MNKFEEFLEKNVKYAELSSINPVSEFDFREKKYISIQDLGEWAWKEAWGKKWELNDDRFEVYREIAIACFGEEEIKKKLKELVK